MGLFSLFRPKAKAVTSTSNLLNPRLWLQDVFGSRTTAGENVSTVTAMSLAPYFDAVRILAEDVANIPFITYMRTDNGKVRAIDHPNFELLRFQPNNDMDAVSFWTAMIVNAAQLGNGYAEIQRDGNGDAVALHPISSFHVKIARDEKCNLVYDVQVPESVSGKICGKQAIRTVRFQQEDIFHLTGVGSNGISGFPVISLASESLGSALALQRFGSAFYGNGTHLSGVLMHPDKLSKEAQDRLRESWMNLYQGAAQSNRPGILEEGMSWQSLGISPKDSQFIEGRQFTTTEIAQWFRIPPHKLGDMSQAKFNNVEEQNIDYINNTLTSWLNRIAMETRRKLFKEEERRKFFAEHLLNAMLRGNMKARGEFYKMLQSLGSINANQIRAAENMNGYEGGDTYYIPMNLQEVGASDVTTSTFPVQRAQVLDSMRPIFESAAQRVVDKEVKAVSRAVKNNEGDNKGFGEWASGFYAILKQDYINAFGPIFLSLNKSIQFDNFDELVNEVFGNFEESVVSHFIMGSVDKYIKHCKLNKIKGISDLFINLASEKEVENEK